MFISGLQKVTLIDYPGRLACVVFTHGCNLRCSFCHNPELVIDLPNEERELSQEYLFDFLDRRKGKLDGVVITGGEPLLNTDLPALISKIKSKGFLVKLDTNGSLPEALESILSSNMVDYVAMDVKTSLGKYSGLSKWKDTNAIERSIGIIKSKAPEYEFRTTVVKGLHTLEDMKSIAGLVKGAERFVLQNFIAGKTLEDSFNRTNQFTKSELEFFAKVFKKQVSHVEIRNSY